MIAVQIHPRSTTTLRGTTARELTASNVVSITLGPWPYEVTLYLPSEDDEAMLVLDHLQAALDNARSMVLLRQDRRDAAGLGILGAGASVEAYRG